MNNWRFEITIVSLYMSDQYPIYVLLRKYPVPVPLRFDPEASLCDVQPVYPLQYKHIGIKCNVASAQSDVLESSVDRDALSPGMVKSRARFADIDL